MFIARRSLSCSLRRSEMYKHGAPSGALLFSWVFSYKHLAPLEQEKT